MTFKKMLDTTETLYTKEKAEAIAAMMNADTDDDWTYLPNHCPNGTGFSFIEVYDEDGEFVAKL